MWKNNTNTDLADRIRGLTSAPFVVTREPGGVPAAELNSGFW